MATSPNKGDEADEDKAQLEEAIKVVNRRNETEAVLRRGVEQDDFARQAVMLSTLAVVLVVAANVLLIISWEKRVVLSLVITGCCFHALTQRLHGISQDYSAQAASCLREPLIHPPPTSSAAHDADKVEFESTEWLNAIMHQLWPIIDRQLFVAAIDLMEDEMMALMPAMIHSVKITSLEQGSHPVQLLGMRILPPQSTDPRTASVFHQPASAPSAPDVPAPPFTRARNARTDGAAGTGTSAFAEPALPRPAPFAADADEQADDPEMVSALMGKGDLGEEGRPSVEMEVEFGYRRRVERKEEDGAQRGEGSVEPMDPTENIHLVVYLGVGVSKLATIPFPVLISVSSLRGAARARLSFTPELPFVKTAVVSLREMPVVEVTAHPLQGTWDVVTLPIATLSNLIMPRRYAIDVRKLLLGGDVATKTRTVGLVVLVLHRATLTAFPSYGGTSTASTTHAARAALSGARATRSIDPHVEVSWAGMSKVLYRTKVVRKVSLGSQAGTRAEGDMRGKEDEEGEARWEEMCFIRVPKEPLDDDSRIRLRVLDHERFGSSHCIGYLDLPVRALHQNPGEWRSRTRETLRPDAARGETERGKEDAEVGQLEYSAAYFPLLEKLQGGSEAEKKKPDLMANVDLGHRAELPAEEHEKQKRTRLDAVKDLLQGRESAPRSHPSGILSFQIHSIADLELDKRVGAVHAGLRHLKPGKSSKAMRRNELPSSYVQAVLNDEMIFRTKLAPFSNAPTFNSGSEAFVRDWTEAVLTFSVMDYRDRDHDVIAGYVSINFNDVLREQAQLSRWFPIQGGSGSGRLRISLLFKPLALDLRPGLREWSVGTLQVVQASVSGISERSFAGRLVLRADQSESASVNAVQRQHGEDDDTISFELASSPLSLPVLSRIVPVEVTLQGHATSGLTQSKRAIARGVFHVSDVRRGEPVELTVWLTSSKRDVLPDAGRLPSLKGAEEEAASSPAKPGDPSTPHRQLRSTPSDGSDPPIVLTLRIRFIPGMSSLHGDPVLSASSSARAAYQLYLVRRDYQAQLAAESGTASSTMAEGAEWESATDAGGEGGSADEIEDKRDGTHARKGGSMRWVRHNAKLLGRRIKKARTHQLSEPAPETEIQASL